MYMRCKCQCGNQEVYYGGIRVKVIDEDSCIEVAGERICICDTYNTPVAEMMTNCAGIAEFRNLRIGEYYLRRGKHLCKVQVDEGGFTNIVLRKKEHKRHHENPCVPDCPEATCGYETRMDDCCCD